MHTRFLLVLLLALSSPALAQEEGNGPVLGELMKLPEYKYAWDVMLSGEKPPQWIMDYSKTLDGPPTPTIPVPLDGEIYTLGFTCRANACEDNQLYVLFAPQARDAWGLLASPEGISWLGRPDQRIQDTITSSLRK